jgi:amino acid adenylation domain-containing protein
MLAKKVFFELSETLWLKMIGYAEQTNATPVHFLQAIFAWTTARYFKQQQLAIVFAGNKDCGQPANTTVEYKASLDFCSINAIRELLIALNENNHPSCNSIADVNFNYLKNVKEEFLIFFEMHTGDDTAVADTSEDHLSTIQESAIDAVNCKLILQCCTSSSGSVKCTLGYNPIFFEAHIVQLFSSTLLKTIDDAVSGLNVMDNSYSFIDTVGYSNIIDAWNATEQYYPEGATVTNLFEAQVCRVPENIALVHGGLALTYLELNEKANQLAVHIRAQFKERTGGELVPNTLVALCFERGIEMVLGILAVLKSGGAYVPIDPGYPPERIAYILADTETKLILSQRSVTEADSALLPMHKVLHIDVSESFYQPGAAFNTGPYSGPDDLAYVIYTSGTTGRPKGVMVEHRAFAQFIYNFNDHLSAQTGLSGRNLLSATNYVFDIFGLEYALPLITGSKITLAALTDIQEADMIEHDIIQQTPSALHYLADHCAAQDLDITCLVGGEALHSATARKLTRLFRRVINVYGPAETVIWSTSYPVTDPGRPFIGKPLPNEQVYVLDANRQPVAVGVAGELYIGGAGLARGYLNRPDLTTERFVPNPFAKDSEKAKGYVKLYKTGDLAKWTAEGVLEYIGRNDDQVKIQGHRVELGEVQHALANMEGIDQACVLAKERVTEAGIIKYLVAYYVTGKHAITEAEILQRLHQILPDYMVPGVLMRVTSFPLTVNGKLDKRALPEPGLRALGDVYIAPATEAEAKLCRIWEGLLGLECVGITDHFFRLGGNSILAIQASHRMSEALGCNIQVADIFKYKSIREILSGGTGRALPVITATNDEHGSLSFSQERLWFIELMEEGTNAYHLPAVYELANGINIEGLKYALQQIVRRHEVLRSTIGHGKDLKAATQVVHNDPLPIEEVLVPQGIDCTLLIKEDINRPFNLIADYPIRVKLYIRETADSPSGASNLLLINMHHIVSDGWSAGIFENELAAFCKAYCNDDSAFMLPPLPIQYRDYAAWQRAYLTGAILEEQLRYWKGKMSGYETLALPTDHVRPLKPDYRGGCTHFTISREVSQRLRLLAQDCGVTLYSVMLGGLSVLLGKYTGQDDVVTGSVIANRQYRQTESLIGFFANTQVNRVRLAEGQTFIQLVKQVHEDQVVAQVHQDLPFEKLIEALNIERDISRHPIFQVMFTVQHLGNQGTAPEHRLESLKLLRTDDFYAVEQFDLSINIDDTGGELSGQVSYAKSLFQQDTIARFINCFTQLLEQVSSFPEQPYNTLCLLAAGEYRQVIYDWNSTSQTDGGYGTIAGLFEKQAQHTPDNIALVFEDIQLTYQALNEKSNQLADCIQKRYYEKTGRYMVAGTPIGLCLERGAEQIIGILAVLKAGGAYVPIDPDCPQERLSYIISDTQTKLILCQRSVRKVSAKLPHAYILYIDLTEDVYHTGDWANLPAMAAAGDLAYIIYTSGTTGRPKGVMVEQSGVVNLIADLLQKYHIEPAERFLLFSNYVFDASVEQMLLPLFSGGTLFIISQALIMDGLGFENFVINNRITHLDATPSFLNSVNPAKLICLKRVVFGAEVLSKTLFDKYKAVVPLIINAYGPTEATITSLVSFNTHLLSGATIQNTRAYVLDGYRNPVPVGVIGELFIAGAGVARGYLNHPELTAERFMPDPFALAQDRVNGNARMYKTGDLVRWLGDGSLEYIGRNDEQVKVRGYRVETGEIEQALLRIEGIQQACVIAKERASGHDKAGFLTAYYIRAGAREGHNHAAIRERLAEWLPEYMVPEFYTELTAFPLTINGKIDKNALPDPLVDLTNQTEYVAPITTTEKAICKIWQESMGLEQVGLMDDFFRIGGSSILAIQVSHRMSLLLNNAVKVADLFRYKRISTLLEHFQEAEAGEDNIEWEV